MVVRPTGADEVSEDTIFPNKRNVNDATGRWRLDGMMNNAV
jgi:hypothetical protein